MAKTVDVTIRGKNETKAGFTDAERDAIKFGDRMKSSILTPMNAIKAAVAGIAAGIIGQFAKASVESAAAADAAWGRVEQAVGNAGITFDAVRGNLDALFTSIQRTTRYSDDDAASAFATLVNVSGDYAGSIKNLTLVANIAAAKQIDLATAATLVGKVMAGETSMLKRYGIVVKEGTDAMQQLSEKFRGFAERDAATLQGRLASIANAWDNVKESVGRALEAGALAVTGTNDLAEALNKLGLWIDDHRQSFVSFVGTIKEIGVALKDAFNFTIGDDVKKVLGPLFDKNSNVGIIGGAISGYQQLADKWRNRFNDPNDEGGDAAYDRAMAANAKRQHEKNLEQDRLTAAQIAENTRTANAAKAERDAEAAAKAMDKRITGLKQEGDLLLRARDIVGLSIKDYTRLADIQAQLTQIANDANEPLKVRVAAAEYLDKLGAQELQRAEKLARARREISNVLPVTVTPSGRGPGFTGPTAAALPGVAAQTADFGREMRTGFDDATESVSALDTSIEKLSYTLGNVAGGALLNFVDTWTQGITDIIAGHETLAQGIIRSVRKAVGQSLMMEGRQTLLKAVAAAAASDYWHAARLFAAGTAQVTAGAALSGSGGGSGYSGGGGGGGVSPSGFSQSQGAASGAGKLTVVFPGGKSVLDPKNPGDLDALREMFEHLAGTRQIEFIVGR